MDKGLAWVGACEHDSGHVIVASEDGKKAILPAVQYVVRGMQPPIFELPQRNTSFVERLSSPAT